MMTSQEQDTFEAARDRFPELDEDGRRRAAERIAAGADAHAALADETLLMQMVHAYNK
jgi:hypothetical protein